jgi:signal transduction histidine kinase
MRQVIPSALLLLMLTLCASVTASQQAPSPSREAERIEALVNEAAARVERDGKAAFTEFRQRGSKWWSGNVYVFAYAPDGTVILNPAVPSREGKAYPGERDKKGKLFHEALLATARDKGSGWVDYWLPKPGEKEPSQKWSYVKAVSADGVALVGAGFYPE